MNNLTINSRFEQSEQVLVQELQGEAVLLDMATGVYFGLNSLGVSIWKYLGDHKQLSEVIEGIVADYDVSEEVCSRDVLELVGRLVENGLLVPTA